MRLRWNRNAGFCPSITCFVLEQSGPWPVCIRWPYHRSLPCSTPGRRHGSGEKHQKGGKRKRKQRPPHQGLSKAHLSAVLPVCLALYRAYMDHLRKQTQIPWVEYDSNPHIIDDETEAQNVRKLPMATQLVVGFGFKPGLSDTRTQALRLTQVWNN